MRVKQLFFLVMAGVFLFTGCNNLADKRNQVKQDDVIDDLIPEKSESEPKLAYLKISGAEIAKADRTINPEFSLDSISNFAFVLSGEKSDDIGNILDIASFENYEQLMEKPIPIEEGLWNLTLTASAEGTILKGIKNNVTKVSGDNSLDFVLKWDSEASTGNGNFVLTFDFSQATTRNEVAAVTGEIVKYNPATREESSLEDWIYGYLAGEQNINSHYSLGWDVGSSGEYEYTFSFLEMNPLSAGTYIAKIRLYADSEKTIPINTWRETLIISGGQTSSATRSVSSLNKVYSITYYDGDEKITSGYQDKYTRLCPDITLPTPIKSGSTFFGWYTKADFSGEKVTAIPKGSTGNLTLYAKWDDAVTITIESSDLNLTYEQETDKIVFNVTGGDSSDYIWYLDGVEQTNGGTSSSYSLTTNTAGTYEIEVRNGYYSATAFVEITDVFINGGFVLVEGGTFTFDETNTLTPESNIFVSDSTITIPNLYVCKHEVTQEEYEKYCWWAYYGDEPNEENSVGKNYPIHGVNWYHTIVYCNLRSVAEGLTPVYSNEGETNPTKWDGIQESDGKYRGLDEGYDWDISFDSSANGYRLPTEAEWEYIARGGEHWDSYTYSGSNEIDKIAWYSENSDSRPHEVMTKLPNSLGIYDMTGNVWEWCWDEASGGEHVLRGGSCHGVYEYYAVCDTCSHTTYGGSFGYGGDRWDRFGFRVVRNAD